MPALPLIVIYCVMLASKCRDKNSTSLRQFLSEYDDHGTMEVCEIAPQISPIQIQITCVQGVETDSY